MFYGFWKYVSLAQHTRRAVSDGRRCSPPPAQPVRAFSRAPRAACPTSVFARRSGKDRTGLVVALTLAVLGVPDEAIVDDYAKSDAAYKELADRDAMVGALSQVRSCSLKENQEVTDGASPR